MASRQAVHTPVEDEIKEMLRAALAKGWSAAFIVTQMNERGHTNWTVPVLTAAAKTRAISIDEGIDLSIVIRGNANIIARKMDETIARLARKERA